MSNQVYSNLNARVRYRDSKFGERLTFSALQEITNNVLSPVKFDAVDTNHYTFINNPMTNTYELVFNETATYTITFNTIWKIIVGGENANLTQSINYNPFNGTALDVAGASTDAFQGAGIDGPRMFSSYTSRVEKGDKFIFNVKTRNGGGAATDQQLQGTVDAWATNVTLTKLS